MTRQLWRFVMAGSLALGLAGCGSTCDKLKSSFDSLSEKAKPCANGGTTVNTSTFNLQKCEANIANCTSDEQKKLEALADCLDDLGTCAPATQNDWSGALLGCVFAHAAGVSDKCGNTALGGGE